MGRPSMSIQPAFDSEMPGIEVFCERVTASFSEPVDVAVVDDDLSECVVETIVVEDMIATAGPWQSCAMAA